MTSYAEGMGVATGIAFDRDGSLYVGDRSGTIFKIGPTARFSSSPRWSPASRPIISLSDHRATSTLPGLRPRASTAVYQVDPHGACRGLLSRPGPSPGLGFDIKGNLYVAASLAGRRGIVKITPDGKATLAVAGQGLVGLAFAPGKSVMLATNSGVHHLDWNIAGLPLPPI